MTLLLGLIMTGCSRSSTNPDAGMIDEAEQTQATQTKLALIEAKKQEFPESIKLNNVADTTQYVAEAYRKVADGQAIIEIEAILPNPGKQIYEVWLRDKDGTDKIRIGALEYNQPDDYSFSFTTQKSIQGYDTIYISRETQPDNSLETVIMTGAFPDSTL